MCEVQARLAATLLLAFAIASPCAHAQIPSPEDQLPDWAQQQFNALKKAHTLKISTRVNPFVWRGDFDGDGKPDLALLVQQTTSGKEGIAILFRGKAKPLVLGAGTRFGNGGDDFSWMDLWNVEDRGTLQKGYHGNPVRPAADGLLVAKEGSASGLIYIQNGKAKWQQQGD